MTQNSPSDHPANSAPDDSSIDVSSLFEDFAPVSSADWEAKIRKDMKFDDAAYQKKMFWSTAEGVTVQPFYRKEDLQRVAHPLDARPGALPFLRGAKPAGNDWNVRHDVDDRDPKAANRRALQSLENSVDEVAFVVQPRGNALYGVDLRDGASAMQTLLDGVWLDAVPVHFYAGAAAPAVLELYAEEIQRRGLDRARAAGSVDFDPVGDFAREGRLDQEQTFAAASELLKTTAQQLPGFRCLGVSDAVYHNAGAGIALSSACALAAGSEMLTQLRDTGHSTDEICARLHFDLSVGANYFFEIARLRMFRFLWARIVREYAPADADHAARAHVHARTSRWNLTLYDPYVNMLRSTTEAMSAVLGSCDSFSGLPFDEAYEAGTEFAERVARNTQHLLKHEAHLDKVADPAAGSYYIESLTDSLARETWAIFQKIEAEGGMLAALTNGHVQQQIEAAAGAKHAAAAARKLILLGTNQYPNREEAMSKKLARPEPMPLEAGRDLGVTKVRGNANIQCTKLNEFRGAEPFEELRLATESYTASGGTVPKVYLLQFGDLAMRKARANFAANFFGCAGYEVIDEKGVDDAEEGGRAAARSGAHIVVLCSSDEEYASLGKAVIGAIESTGLKQHVVVAGFPKDVVDELKAAGAQDFIHMKANVLEVLTNFQKAFGIM